MIYISTIVSKSQRRNDYPDNEVMKIVSKELLITEHLVFINKIHGF